MFIEIKGIEIDRTDEVIVLNIEGECYTGEEETHSNPGTPPEAHIKNIIEQVELHGPFHKDKHPGCAEVAWHGELTTTEERNIEIAMLFKADQQYDSELIERHTELKEDYAKY